MAEQPSVAPRYWIFKDSSPNLLRNAPNLSEVQWIIRPHTELKPSDIVYFWSEKESPSFYGWGVINSEPTPLKGHDAGITYPPPAGSRFGVQVKNPFLFSSPVTRTEVDQVPALRSLSELRETKETIIKLNNSEAAALNQLIRVRNVEVPPDPPEEPEVETGVGGENGGDRVPPTTLDRLLEIYADRLSHLSRDILEQARRFALNRERHRGQVTTSCILFAAIELGQGFSDQEVDNAAQFLYRRLADLGGPAYRQALARFLRDSDLQRMQGLVVATSNTLKVLETAYRIANIVRKETIPLSKQGVINARDLIGALLFTSSLDQGSGAASRLAHMDVNLESLRSSYFTDYLDHEKNPDDDIEKWRRIIIDLELPEKKQPKIPELKPSIPAIDADTPSIQTDLLNISAEVRGFAKIIAAKDVKTPLSIGLFGDWGSGKSTFMEQLQTRVDWIAKGVRAKKEDEETAFLGNIVQIKFNAWHYAEANLWASLVSHVFENLSFFEDEEKQKSEQRKQLVLGQLVTGLAKQQAAEADAKVKEAKYEDAKSALEGAQRAQENARFDKLQWVTRGIWPIALEFLRDNDQAQKAVANSREVLGKEGLTEEELRKELAASRSTLGQAELHLKAILKDPYRGLIIIAIILASVLIPLALGFLLDWADGSQTLHSAIMGVMPYITLLGGGFAWLKSKRSTVQGWIDTISKAETHLNQAYADAKSQYRDELSRLTDEVKAREKEIIAASEQVRQKREAVTDTLTELKEMEPSRVLERFVQERAASEDYRKLLGIVALIRRDFKKLSDMLREQDNTELRDAVREIVKKDEEQRKLNANANGNKGAPAESEEQLVEKAMKDYRIDRIVLYIDDLDRCPPKQVVDVLQAIHLLLAFELFVVVVGVDSRWIRHALREQFPRMLSEDWDDDGAGKNAEERLGTMATPRDYVEKIFQVPFWLKPMSDDDSQKLLEGLIPKSQLIPLSRPAESENAKDGTKDKSGTGKGHLAPTGPKVPGGAEILVPGTQYPPGGSGAGGQTLPTLPSASQSSFAVELDEFELVLKPDSLLFDVKERDTMIALSRLIGRTPRALKRFVNVYRIIKAGLGPEDLAAFVGTRPDDAQYPAVLVLLAVAHGAPEVAPTFFRVLRLKNDRMIAEKQKDVGFKTFLQSTVTRPATLDESFEPVWVSLTKELQHFTHSSQYDIPVGVLRKWLPVIVRYTFQLGPLCEEVAIRKDRRS